MDFLRSGLAGDEGESTILMVESEAPRGLAENVEEFAQGVSVGYDQPERRGGFQLQRREEHPICLADSEKPFRETFALGGSDASAVPEAEKPFLLRTDGVSVFGP